MALLPSQEQSPQRVPVFDPASWTLRLIPCSKLDRTLLLPFLWNRALNPTIYSFRIWCPYCPTMPWKFWRLPLQQFRRGRYIYYCHPGRGFGGWKKLSVSSPLRKDRLVARGVETYSLERYRMLWIGALPLWIVLEQLSWNLVKVRDNFVKELPADRVYSK